MINRNKEVEEVLVDEGAIFYHTSLNKDLKQISPFHKPSMPILFEYPKFFAGYNIPLIRDGSTLFKTKKSKSFLENENYGTKGTRIYQIPTDLVLNDIRTNNARVVIDYDVFGASNSVSIICFKGQSYPVIDITEKYFNQE